MPSTDLSGAVSPMVAGGVLRASERAFADAAAEVRKSAVENLEWASRALTAKNYRAAKLWAMQAAAECHVLFHLESFRSSRVCAAPSLPRVIKQNCHDRQIERDEAAPQARAD